MEKKFKYIKKKHFHHELIKLLYSVGYKYVDLGFYGTTLHIDARKRKYKNG
jgi:hypothetical protein